MCQEGQCRGSCCPCPVSAATWPVPELAHPVPQPSARTGPGGQRRNGTRLKVAPLPERLGPLHHQHGRALSHWVRGFSPLDYYKELEVSRHWLGIGRVSPGACCQPCRHHPPWLAPPRARALLHLPLGRLQLMPGVLSTHLLVTCRNGPCGRH